jgi:hypothetical protein
LRFSVTNLEGKERKNEKPALLLTVTNLEIDEKLRRFQKLQ